MNACTLQLWQECLDRFDVAKAMDPAGDTDPVIQRARRKAEDALRASLDGGRPRTDKP
jgi:hypothetical protein